MKELAKDLLKDYLGTKKEESLQGICRTSSLPAEPASLEAM